MKKLASLLMAVAGLINLAPISGVLSADRLFGLYGIRVESADLEILLRHRAVLLGLVGAGLLLAVLLPKLRIAASAAAFVSMLSFVAVAWSVGGYNAEIGRVLVADWIAIAALAAALTLDRVAGRSAGT